MQKYFDPIKWERIWLLAKIEFKLRYYENKLGLVWALFKPLFEMLIYWVAFTQILSTDIPNYAVYLFIGIITYGFFTECSGGLMAILKTKKYLYEYSNMSKLEIYVSSMLSITLGYAFNLLIFVVAMLLSGISIGWNILYFPLVFFTMFTFCFGLALILSNLYLLAKDIKQIWSLLTTMLFWLSPILFHYNAIKTKLPVLDYINPIAGLIINTRNTVMFNQPPSMNLLTINFIHAALFLLVGLLMLNKIGKRASELQ